MKNHNNQPRTRDDAIDPALESLLDEALAAPEAPEGLNERVLAATQRPLAARRRPDAVLARIGLASAWRAAAAVAVVGLLGWAAVTLLAPQEPALGPAEVAQHGPAPAGHHVALSEAEQRELLVAFAAAEGLNFETFWQERRSGLYGEADDWDDAMWTGSDDPVDMLLDTYEIEWLGADEPRFF